jgi:hypothetical protein
MSETRRPGRPRKPCVNAPSSTPVTDESSSPDCGFIPGETPRVDLALEDVGGIVGDHDSLGAPNYPGNMGSPLGPIGIRNNAEIVNFDFSVPLESFSSATSSGRSKQNHLAIDMQQCLKDLSELNVELYSQHVTVKAICGAATPAHHIRRESTPTNISAFTVAERSLTAIQKFYGIISNIERLLCQSSQYAEDCEVVNLETDTCAYDNTLDLFAALPLPTPDEEQQPAELETALVLIVISCYVQLINIFFDLCNCIQNYLKCLKKNEAVELLDAIRSIQVGSFCVWDGRLQGLMFCTIITHYLDRVERVLGLLPEQRYQSIPVRNALLRQPCHRELLDQEFARGGTTSCSSPRTLRDVIQNLHQALAADPSW